MKRIMSASGKGRPCGCPCAVDAGGIAGGVFSVSKLAAQAAAALSGRTGGQK